MEEKKMVDMGGRRTIVLAFENREICFLPLNIHYTTLKYS